jgi:two-component system, OmpR family, response regulator BaeR
VARGLHGGLQNVSVSDQARVSSDAHDAESGDALAPAILLVEDDPKLATMLSDRLTARRYRVWHVATAAEADRFVDEVQPDLMILDLMLPDRNGLLLCAELRARAQAPIIICSATQRRDDAALGLRLGAHDFVAKPFSVDELQLRIERALRPPVAPVAAAAEARPAPVLRVCELVIDRAQCQARVRGQALKLTPTEYRLLCVLASRPNAVVSRVELAESIWGMHDAAIARTLDVHMRRLRAKLSAAGADRPALATRRGLGYQLISDAIDVANG